MYLQFLFIFFAPDGASNMQEKFQINDSVVTSIIQSMNAPLREKLSVMLFVLLSLRKSTPTLTKKKKKPGYDTTHANFRQTLNLIEFGKMDEWDFRVEIRTIPAASQRVAWTSCTCSHSPREYRCAGERLSQARCCLCVTPCCALILTSSTQCGKQTAERDIILQHMWPPRFPQR